MMQAATAATPTWKLDGLTAKNSSATLDLSRPALGLATPNASGVDHVLGLDLRTPAEMPVPPTDSWVRGDDIVAVYRPADPRLLEATAMWRRLPGRPNTWELILSAQTALVESDGSLAVISEVASGEVWCGDSRGGTTRWFPFKPSTSCVPHDATSVLVRRDSDAILIAVHPTDSRRIVVAPERQHTRIACWLFSAAIEKGVLHRGRVLASVGPKDDASWADDLIRDFSASPPPLTA